MKFIVCIKRVPEVSEVEVKIDPNKKKIVTSNLSFDINEPDSYALEEAVLLKEKVGGDVTVISVDTKEVEDTLRMALAKGGDNAIRIQPPEEELNAESIARIIASVAKELEFDLLFTGCIAVDTGEAQIGPMVAELCDVPHTTLVTGLELNDNKIVAKRELEGGILEELEITLPAVISIQTGINEPRYASLLAIRRAAVKPIEIKEIKELNLTPSLERVKLKKLSYPQPKKRAQIIEGTPEEISEEVINIIKTKGLV
jgi:electron transfer flavoprotein beta subunit